VAKDEVEVDKMTEVQVSFEKRVEEVLAEGTEDRMARAGEGRSWELEMTGERGQPEVASHIDQLESGWRCRVAEFLARHGLSDEGGAMEELMNAGQALVGSALQVSKASSLQEIKQELDKEAAMDKCQRSMMIHNVDKWLAGDKDTEGHGVANRVVAAINRVTGGGVAITDAYHIGRKDKSKPTSVHVTFASTRQKYHWYRVMATQSRLATREGQRMRGVSFRDSFPKEKVSEARRLAQRGAAIKRDGQIGSFRVKASGPGCNPVLEVRMEAHRGPGGWMMFKDSMEAIVSQAAKEREEIF
jgi:hypothetical protein